MFRQVGEHRLNSWAEFSFRGSLPSPTAQKTRNTAPPPDGSTKLIGNSQSAKQASWAIFQAGRHAYALYCGSNVKSPRYGIPVLYTAEAHRYDKGVPRPSEKAGLCLN